ncbi:MAG: hypothetical protein M1303_07310 [Bacteroidetes bacterium]|nr:hypothetical protein [Bacteroidota bacterium]
MIWLCSADALAVNASGRSWDSVRHALCLFNIEPLRLRSIYGLRLDESTYGLVSTIP